MLNYRHNKTCIDCGKPIVDRATRCKACSAKAREAILRPPTMTTCIQCGKEFRIKPSRKNECQFCSRQCQREFYMIPCPVCGKMFKPHHTSRAASHTCSHTCRAELRRIPKVELTCQYCGKIFKRYPSQIRDELNFCGTRCFNRWWSGHSRGWISSAGYRYICIKGRELFEHRYVMEQHLGRPLELNEVVHHINGDRLDNRLANLELMSRGSHSTLHNLERHHRNHETTIA